MAFLGALAFRARDVAGPVNSLRTKGLRASAQSICLGRNSSPGYLQSIRGRTALRRRSEFLAQLNEFRHFGVSLGPGLFSVRKLFARCDLFPAVLINQAECIVAARITWIVFDDLVCRKFG